MPICLKLSLECHKVGSPWICIQKEEVVKSISYHERFGHHFLRIRWPPQMDYGRLWKAFWEFASCWNLKRKILYSNFLTSSGYTGRQALETTTLTMFRPRGFVDMNLPISMESRLDWGSWFKGSLRWMSWKEHCLVRLTNSETSIATAGYWGQSDKTSAGG